MHPLIHNVRGHKSGVEETGEEYSLKSEEKSTSQ